MNTTPTSSPYTRNSTTGSCNRGGTAHASSPTNESSMSDSQLMALIKQTEEIIESIPRADKAAYQRAKEVVPHIVQAETSILYFLRSQQWDPHIAAHRLVKFWKYRQDFFDERYLLPMVQTGHGALDEIDIQLVRSGGICVVGPDNGTLCVLVNFNRATRFFMDLSRINGTQATMRVNRLAYYICTIYGDVGSACKDVVVCHVITTARNRPAMEIRLDIWDMARTASPMPIHRTVVCQRHEAGKETLLDFLRYQTARVLGYNSKLPPVEIAERSVQKTLQVAQTHGISPNALPVALGGQLDYTSQMEEWVRMRVSVEGLLGAAHPVRNAVPRQVMINAAGARRKTGHFLAKRKRDASGTVIESEAEFQRKRNALYARRSYHKNKLTITSLKCQVESLKRQAHTLCQENFRLEDLCLKVHRILVSLKLREVTDPTSPWQSGTQDSTGSMIVSPGPQDSRVLDTTVWYKPIASDDVVGATVPLENAWGPVPNESSDALPTSTYGLPISRGTHNSGIYSPLPLDDWQPTAGASKHILPPPRNISVNQDHDIHFPEIAAFTFSPDTVSPLSHESPSLHRRSR